MKNLKEKLIRLGNTNPDLRKDLRPILDKLSNRRDSEFLYQEKMDTIVLMMGRIKDVLAQKRRDIEKDPRGYFPSDVNELGHVEDLLEQIIQFLGKG